MEVSTCFMCLREKKTISLSDIDWGIVPRTEIECCNICLAKALKAISPWRDYPASLLAKKRLLSHATGIQIALVAHFKYANSPKRKIKILVDDYVTDSVKKDRLAENS